MADVVTGAALVAELAAMLAILATYDASKYVQSKNTSEYDWYGIVDAAFTSSDSLPLLTSPDYTKANAITDSEPVVADLFNRYSIDTLTPILNAQVVANGWNSTTAQLLANDAMGQVVATGVRTKIQNIGNYAKTTQDNIGIYVNLINLGKGTMAVTTVSSAPYGIDMSAMMQKTIESVGQWAGSVNASVDLVGSISGILPI